jgi:heme-degrading monooxygenase HmoA
MIKWVRCRAVDVDAFDRGQRAWGELSDVPGFLSQCGGWSRREPGVAQVFAWWRSQLDHQAFITGAHDRLATGQVDTYDAIEVRLWEHHLDIGPGIPADCSAGSVVRLAHCQVKAGRQERFVRAQGEVWNPGMQAAPGMLGGVFARRGQTEFLVLSLWKSVADHERYRTDRFADLRHRSRAADDLDDITGDLIELDPAWTVAA